MPPRTAAPTLRGGWKILLAGVDKETRALVEAEVAEALATREPSEKWTVSLVRIAGKWSVTLDGPEPRFRNLSFPAEDGRLAEAIRERVTVQVGSGVAVANPPSAETGSEQRERVVCESCRQAFFVSYEAQPSEGRVETPVACPHCWQINRVEVGAWAAAGRDYRAEKA